MRHIKAIIYFLCVILTLTFFASPIEAQTLAPTEITPTFGCVSGVPCTSPLPTVTGAVSPTIFGTTPDTTPGATAQPTSGTNTSPTVDPCATSQTSIQARHKKHRKHRGNNNGNNNNSGSLEKLIQRILDLLKQLGIDIPGLSPTPNPTVTPIPGGTTPSPSGTTTTPSSNPVPTSATNPCPTGSVAPTVPNVSPSVAPSVAPSTGVSVTPGTTGTPGTGRVYPMHTNIVATTFWVGENFRSASDGSQVCSAYNSHWAETWGPAVDTISTLVDTTDCNGAPIGGCDGVRGALVDSGGRRTVDCQTETRTSANGYFPAWSTAAKQPRENPFYLDLPFNDVSEGFSTRCTDIPWANDPGYAGKCSDQSFSYMKNRWVKITGPNGNTCYGQVEDAGPADDTLSRALLYRDAPYVFGSNDARPDNPSWGNAGMDVSPALNGCLGFSALDGDGDHVSWQWVDDVDVAAGPWKNVVTTGQVQ